jgi:serralysin
MWLRRARIRSTTITGPDGRRAAIPRRASTPRSTSRTTPTWRLPAHYLLSGAAEGRATHAAVGTVVDGFEAQYYLSLYPDIMAARVDPLEHFNQHGWREGRNPNAVFDTAGYLAHYADVRGAGSNPLQHYELFGWREGRDPSASFDTRGYLAANPDVAAAGINPLDHYLQFGIFEGRTVVNDGVWR